MKTPPTETAYRHPLEYRPDIDGLRGIAVFAVVAFHSGLRGFNGGFAGVDIFFVLSGYLISGIIIRALDANAFSFREFYLRRINRIFPALVVVLAATFLLGWYLLFRHEFVSLGRHIAAGAGFMSNVALVRETGYFDVAAEKKPLLHLWSLAIEEQFYLVWPLLLFLSWRVKRGFILPAMLVGAVSFFFTMVFAGEQSASAFFLPFTRLWELASGCALFWLERERHPTQISSQKNTAPIVGVILIGAAIVGVNERLSWPGPWTIVPIAGTILMIYSGKDSWINKRVLAHPLLVGLGLISYPLYLWHWPLLAFMRFVLPHGPSVHVVFAMIALSLLLSVATYRAIELPIRSRATGRGRRAVILVVSLAFVGILGAFASTQKIHARLDRPEIRSIQAALVDWYYPEGGFTGKGLRENVVAGGRDTVLYIGDSHMEQYWPRIDSLVRADRPQTPTAIFSTVRGCPVLPGVGRKDIPACTDFYAAAMRRARTPGIRSVVISSFWDDFYRRRLIFLADDRNRSPLEVHDAASDSMLTQFERDLRSLVQAGKKVFVLLSIPVGPRNEFDPREWLPGRTGASRVPSIIPSISRAEYTERVAPVESRIRAAAQHAGAVIIDPVPTLCTEVTCPTIDSSGDALYMDSRHLRASVARKRATWIDATLR